MVFEDRILKNPRLLRLKNQDTGEITDFEMQDLKPDEIVQEGTEVNAETLNQMQDDISAETIFCTIPNEEDITNAYKDITTWSQNNVIGKNLTIQNGVIKIGKNIKKVKITVKLRFYITGSGAIYSYIRKNNSNIVPSWAVVSYPSAGYNVVMNDVIIDVSEGDAITASVYSETSKSTIQKNSTTIIVEKLA